MLRCLEQHQWAAIVVVIVVIVVQAVDAVVVAAGIGSRSRCSTVIVRQLLLIVSGGHRMCVNISEAIAQSRRCSGGQMMPLCRRRWTALSGSSKAVMTHIRIDQIHVRGSVCGVVVVVVCTLDALRGGDTGDFCGQRRRMTMVVEAGRQGEIEGRIGGQVKGLGELFGSRCGSRRWRRRGIVAAAAATRGRTMQEWTTQLGRDVGTARVFTGYLLVLISVFKNIHFTSHSVLQWPRAFLALVNFGEFFQFCVFPWETVFCRARVRSCRPKTNE